MSDLYWLTEEQMALLEHYFPKSHSIPRVDATGAERDHLRQPQRLALAGCASSLRSAQTLYNRWKRWSEAGVFIRIRIEPVRHDKRRYKRRNRIDIYSVA